MARPAGLEPATIRLEGGCSIQLSYGRFALFSGGSLSAAPRRRSGTYANEGIIASGKFEFLPFFRKARFA